MAKHEQDREDLIREATRLVPRAQWHVGNEADPIVLGIRLPEALSIFFGADPVFHFTSDGALRRGYAGGLLWKAEHGRLVRMERRRTAQAVELVSRFVDLDEQKRIIEQWSARIERLRLALAEGSAEFEQGVGQQASDSQFWLTTLAKLGTTVRVADRPRVV